MMLRERLSDKITALIIMMVSFIALAISIFAVIGIVYVVWHFVEKFW